MKQWHRRDFLKASATALLASAIRAPSRAFAAAPNFTRTHFTRTHGLSSFGDLALPEGFAHFDYVNPNAPKGGLLAIQLTHASGNQNFDTFDTLNTFTFKGNGAAGMGACFDSLMTSSLDEPDSLYGLLAHHVDISDDKSTYRFFLREEARFQDGTKVTAEDVVFSLKILKDKGHPIYRLTLREFVDAVAEDAQSVSITLSPNRSRDLHLAIAGLPIFSKAWWQTRDFEAAILEQPLGSGAYKVGKFEQGRFIEFVRDKNYWARDLNVNVGLNNFDTVRFEYFRERQVAFEAFKSGVLTYHEEYTARLWATAYDFPAVKDGHVLREVLPNNQPVPTQGWYMNTRRAQFADVRIREALGLCFDFEWTNKNIMYSAYQRLNSYFQNTPMEAKGLPSDDELVLLNPLRDKLSPRVFEEAYVPPRSDGSGADRALLRSADALLQQAGCVRKNGQLFLPNGAPFTIEFLDSSGALQPHTEPFQANLKRLGITAITRLVDVAQYQRRLEQFDFDIVTMALGGSRTPGDELRGVYASESADLQGSRNLAGIKDPAVDALVDIIAKATTRKLAESAARALDRVLRAAFYCVPMWYKDKALVAHWDMYSRPETAPRYGLGAPDTWWYDADKAKRIGR